MNIPGLSAQNRVTGLGSLGGLPSRPNLTRSGRARETNRVVVRLKGSKAPDTTSSPIPAAAPSAPAFSEALEDMDPALAAVEARRMEFITKAMNEGFDPYSIEAVRYGNKNSPRNRSNSLLDFTTSSLSTSQLKA